MLLRGEKDEITEHLFSELCKIPIIWKDLGKDRELTGYKLDHDILLSRSPK